MYTFDMVQFRWFSSCEAPPRAAFFLLHLEAGLREPKGLHFWVRPSSISTGSHPLSGCQSSGKPTRPDMHRSNTHATQSDAVPDLTVVQLRLFFRRRLGTVGQNTYKNRLKIEYYSMSIYMAVYVQTMSTALNPQPHSLCPSDQQLTSCKDNMTKLFEPTVKKSVNSHTWTIGRGPFRHFWPRNFQTIAGYRKELSTTKVFEVHPVHMSKWCGCIIRHLLRVWWVRQHLLPAPSMFLPESFQNACCRKWNLFTNTCAGFCEVWFADVLFLASQLRLSKCRAPCAPGPSPLVLRRGARQQSLHAAVGGHTQSKTSANSTSEHHDFWLMPS